MNTENAKKMMDAFYEAKRIRDQLPPLPAGVNSSYINTLDAVHQLSEEGTGQKLSENGENRKADQKRPVRVSDVAQLQNLPRPTVSRTIKEMVSKGLLSKEADESDRRVVHLVMTDEGMALYQAYVKDYFDSLTQELSDISDAEVEAMVRTIHRIGQALR